MEVRQFDQYVIRIDGYSRVTVWNQKCLRNYTPVYAPAAKQTIETDVNHMPRATRPMSAFPMISPLATRSPDTFRMPNDTDKVGSQTTRGIAQEPQQRSNDPPENQMPIAPQTSPMATCVHVPLSRD